tara:strand:- start:103 stop:399 length:297 start_codon:yes stop_codon:yes gene_type:complete
MKQTVTESIFRDTMRRLRPDNFTWGNLSHLYHYLIDGEAGGNYEMEFDPIGICCDFDEYQNFKEFQEAYGKEYQIHEDIEDMTTVIYGDGDSFIIQAF